MTIEKGKTSNGYAKWTYLDSPDLAGGGYLTFIVSVIKNTTTKIKILIMYLSITTTSFSDLKKSVRGWHNRPAFTLFSVLPLTSDYSDKLYYTTFFGKIQALFYCIMPGREELRKLLKY